MPVYIRKNVSYTPPSIDKIPHEQEDDFVTDPELLRDDLPQPYRMIDKTLRNLFDDSWEIIATREEERLAEARKVRPPQYEYAVALDGPVPASQHPEKQTLSYATCMCNSQDGQYIFIGMPCGLVVLEALTQQFTGSWEDANAEITYIKSHTIGPQMYLLVTIDDMGIGRLFAYGNNKVFLLKVMNTNPSDSDSKILVSKMEASTEGDYLGMVMENASTRELWLEVHKMPRDTWVSDLDTIITAMKKKEEMKEKKEEMVSEQDTESVVASELGGASQAETAEPSVASLPSGPGDAGDQSQLVGLSSKSRRGSERQFKAVTFSSTEKRVTPRSVYMSRPGSGGTLNDGNDPFVLNIEKPKDPLSGDYKFGSPNMIMKVKSPAPVTGVAMSSIQASCQKVDSGDVVGMGQNHVFTQNHIDLRQSVFDHLHDNLLKYLPDDEEDNDKLQQYPIFHFLTAGRMLPLGLEQANLEGRPTTIAVWWPGFTNLMQYSLIKTSKDVEFKADLVWPFTCKITCTEVSPDTNVIAIGLENGNVVIWDRYMGTQRGVVNVRDDSAVVQLKFLDTAMYPQDREEYPPYPTKTGAYLLVMCANSALYSVATGPGLSLQPNTISIPVESDNDTITMLQPFHLHPDLLLTVTRKGEVQLRDTLQGKILCQISLPATHEMSSPWDPILALGGNGQMLYIKAIKKIVEDSSEIDSETSLQSGTVFVYQLRSFPTLDKHWNIQRPSHPYTVHTTKEQRVEALLSMRIKQQESRRERMQNRWASLKEEINTIHDRKESARMRAESRPVVTPGSVGLMPVY